MLQYFIFLSFCLFKVSLYWPEIYSEDISWDYRRSADDNIKAELK